MPDSSPELLALAYSVTCRHCNTDYVVAMDPKPCPGCSREHHVIRGVACGAPGASEAGRPLRSGFVPLAALDSKRQIRLRVRISIAQHAEIVLPSDACCDEDIESGDCLVLIYEGTILLEAINLSSRERVRPAKAGRSPLASITYSPITSPPQSPPRKLTIHPKCAALSRVSIMRAVVHGKSGILSRVRLSVKNCGGDRVSAWIRTFGELSGIRKGVHKTCSRTVSGDETSDLELVCFRPLRGFSGRKLIDLCIHVQVTVRGSTLGAWSCSIRERTPSGGVAVEGGPGRDSFHEVALQEEWVLFDAGGRLLSNRYEVLDEELTRLDQESFARVRTNRRSKYGGSRRP